MCNEKAFWVVVFAAVMFGLMPSVALAQNGSHGEVEPAEGYGEVENEEGSEGYKDAEELVVAGEEEEVTNQREEVVREERVERVERSSSSWAGVLARNALAGGLTGGLIGIGFWLLTDMNFSWFTIAQFAGGGILVGTVIGAVELASASDRTYVLTQPDSIQWVQQEAAKPMMVPLLEVNF